MNIMNTINIMNIINIIIIIKLQKRYKCCVLPGKLGVPIRNMHVLVFDPFH